MRSRHHFAHVQRPTGPRGIKYRSKAEARYAAYLDFLVAAKQVQNWEYESRTFWFTPDAVKPGVRRGVTCYRPDFRVISPTNVVEWHEVKGYMDARSRVALKRMAKYYPAEKVVVIDSKVMRALARQVGGVVPGWIT